MSNDLVERLRDVAEATGPNEARQIALDAADRIEELEARIKTAVATLRKGFKSGDPTKTAAAIILAIAELEGHGE